GALSALCVLVADNNQLTSLPAEIGQLSKLKKLNLANNRLTTLPAQLCAIPKVKIDLADNPIRDLKGLQQAIKKGDLAYWN
ncbi:leucine-rich repeat domain-containing protein, partial [Klebsiella pneumoniae]|nr:leucine-rich repeat domain-containing protein [Klebsiella pneumoniae]